MTEKPTGTGSDEAARLAALHRYNVLDSEAEQVFDDLAELAAETCGTPIALISLVDETRQWFKSHVGLDISETPRDVSFCAHAIQDDELFEIEDASADERFADNALVTGEPGIRFYAGAPLQTGDGFRLGTLCVIDRQPRRLEDEQRRTLRRLARQVVSQLELRRALSIVRQSHTALQTEVDSRRALETAQRLSERFMRATIDSLEDTIAIVGVDGDIIHVNETWARFAEVNGGPHLIGQCGPGVNYIEVCRRAAAGGCEEARRVAEALTAILAGSDGGFTLEYPCHAPHEQRWFVLRITSFGLGSDRHAVITHRNVTERRNSSKAIQELNQSLESRVRDRTQDLQRAYAELQEKEQRLRESEGQLRGLNKRLQQVREDERTGISREIHDELGQMLTALKIDITLLGRDIGAKLGNDAVPDAIQTIEDLIDATIDSVRGIAQRLRPEVLDALGLLPAIEWHASEFGQRTGIRCRVVAAEEQPELDVDQRSAFFRIVQECLTNVARHADAGEVTILLGRQEGSLRLQVRDDGRGVRPADLVATKSLGVAGMRERAAMIGAGFAIDSPGEGKGTTVTVELPLGGDTGAGM